MTFGVVVLPVHHVDAGPLEVFLRVEFEIVGRESSSRARTCTTARNMNRRIEIPFVDGRRVPQPVGRRLSAFCSARRDWMRSCTKRSFSSTLRRQHERIRILHAHAAIEAVERQRHRVPARGQRFEIAKRQRIGGHLFAGTLGAGNAQRKSVALGGLERVDHVQVVRPGLRPVFPGMHGGVGADVRIRPVRGRALLVVALHRLVVVERVVAEELAKCAEQVAVPDEPVPVVVADLVPQVAEHGAIAPRPSSRACFRETPKSASAMLSVMMPSSWPVITGSPLVLRRKWNATPSFGHSCREERGSFSEYSV